MFPLNPTSGEFSLKSAPFAFSVAAAPDATGTTGFTSMVQGWVQAAPKAALAQADTTPVRPVVLGSPAITAAAAAATPTGTTGDIAMKANIARAEFNVTGAGVTVGILSDSFNLGHSEAAAVASGALPAGIDILQEGPIGSTDEGQAMAELVHRVAPGAQIDFATAFNGEASFAANILALAAAGCKVIVDDVTYLSEPFFQAGDPIAQAIATVTAEGVSYFTAASNEGGNFYQSNFAPLQTVLPGLSGGFLADNFGTAAAPKATETLTVARGSSLTIDLQWDQPFASIGSGHASANSLGMVLYDGNGRIVATAMQSDVGGDPVQILNFTNITGGTDFHLAVVTNGGATTPGLFKFIVYGNGTTIDDPNAGIGSGTVTGHELSPTANTVGAVAAASAVAGNDTPESFSSVGPGTILFDAEGNRLAVPVSESKVNFLAPDGVSTSEFGMFYGTSAAAPDAAGVAALMLQANHSLTPAQVTAMLTASAISANGTAADTGAGLIQATSAVQMAANAPISDVVASVAAQPASLHDFVPLVAPSQPVVAYASHAAGSAQSWAMLNNVDAPVVPVGGPSTQALFG